MGGRWGCRSHSLPGPHHIRHCSLALAPSSLFWGMPILGKGQQGWSPYAAFAGAEEGQCQAWGDPDALQYEWKFAVF